MGRGFLAGIFWGGIVGLALLVVSSQTMERQQLSFPQPDASPVEVPGGSEFNQSRVETDPVVPEPESRPEAEVLGEVAAPADAVEEPPTFDTSALEVPTPEVQSPAGLGDAPAEAQDAPEAPAITDAEQPASAGVPLETPEAPGAAPGTVADAPEASDAPEAGSESDATVEGGGDVAVETEIAGLPPVDAETPSGTDAGTAPRVSTEDSAPVAPVAPDVGNETSLPGTGEVTDTPRLPQIAQEPSLPEADAPDVPEVADAPEAPDVGGAGSVTVDAGAESFLKPVDSLEDQAENVDTTRLPQIGGGSESAELPAVIRPGDDAVEPEVEVQAEAPVDGPALLVHSTDFDNPEGNPLMSVILVQTGDVLSAAQLASLPEHVAFAIDAADEGAALKAAYYRDAGREVVLIPSLPQGARPQDVEQALRVNFQTVPEAVAVMDVSGGRFQTDRAAVSQVVDVVADTGHGLITFPRGLNTVHQRAERAGVPTGLIFRNLDGGDETSEQIRRTMDRAAFRARQEDAVILVGTTATSTLAAIVEWSLGNRSTSVTIGPISAALLDG